MSDENKTANDKRAAAALPSGALTRIPVTQIFWAENIDLPGGHGQVSNTKCEPPKHDSDRYFTCDFIPAWQVLELAYIAGKDSQPIVSRIPIAHVRRFV